MSSSKTLDIRWKQRLENFSSAFDQLKDAVKISKKRKLSALEKLGSIQTFKFTHELAWNVMKDYFDYERAVVLVTGPRDATKEAFNKGFIENDEVWIEMIESRNQTSCTYNKKVADEIVEKIQSDYFKEFELFFKKMSKLAENGQPITEQFQQ